MNSLLSMAHPTIWKLISGLKKMQQKTDADVEHLVAGDGPPRPRKVYLNVTKRLETIVGSYGGRTTEEFLRGIARNFNYVV